MMHEWSMLAGRDMHGHSLRGQRMTERERRNEFIRAMRS